MPRAVSNVPDPEIGTVGVKDPKCFDFTGKGLLRLNW